METPADKLRKAPARDSARIIADARAGSTDALAALYRDHADALMAVAHRLLMSVPDAEDVVHDVFVGLPEALRRYEERGSFAAWLKRITVRVALSRIRSEQRSVELEHADGIAAAPRDVVGNIALADAVAALSPSLRVVLVLREIEGFTHAEISTMLGISTAASEVRLHRALRALRTMLKEDR